MNSIKNDFTNMNIKDFINYIINFNDIIEYSLLHQLFW